MKMKFAAAAIALMLSQGAIAQDAPQACPLVSELQSVGVTMPMQDQQAQGQWWGVTLNNTFGTTDNWTFVAGPVAAQSQQGVITEVNDKLASLGEGMGPMASEDGTMFGCVYFNQQSDFLAVTITPPVAMDSAMKFMRQVRRK